MKTYKEYIEKGFLGAPELYLKNGDEIDIMLAAELVPGSNMDVADLESWNNGILQNTHPVDVIAGQGTYDTVYRSSWMHPFKYCGQCFANEKINRNPQISRRVYICSPYNDKDAKVIMDNLHLVKKCCKHIIKDGNIPIAPHIYFTRFLDDGNEIERALGLEMGIELLKQADSMMVMIKNEKISPGMEREIKYAANHLGIPIEINYIEKKGR